MAKYAASRVVSLRIDNGLLQGLRSQAKREGRSVSGQIVWCVRKQVESETREPAEPQPITGWLAHRNVPDTHQEFREGRAQASQTLRASVRKKARTK